MKLQKLHLRNFRGIESLTIETDGKSLNVQGDNATGKTTVANAYTYLLTGKAYDGEAGFDPKTIGQDGPMHNLNHIVSGDFIKDDGSLVTLEKDYHEIWTKQRGSKTETMTGNTVDHYVNGVPVKAKDFAATVEELFGTASEIQMLSNPRYFAESLPWKERRDILLAVCGDVDESTVINRVKGLQEALLKPGTTDQYYTVEELQTIKSAERKKINAELTTLPARIDEANRALPDITGIDEKKIKAEIKALQAKIKDLEAARDADKEGELERAQLITKLNTELINLQFERDNLKADHNKEQRTAVQEVEDAILAAEQNLAKINRESKQNDENISFATTRVETIQKRRADIQAQIKAVMAETYTGSTTCPTCGQELPEEQQATAREQWNQSKSQRIEALKQQGAETCSREMLEDAIQNLTDLKANTASFKTKIKEADDKINLLKAAKPAKVEFETTDVFKEISQKIIKKEQEIADAKAVDSLALPENDNHEQIAELQLKIDANQLALQRLKIAEEQQERIAILELNEATLGRAFEAAEHALALCEQYIKTKADMLTANVNNKFRTVSFKLFEEQVNGGIKDLCEVLIPAPGGEMIPWASANHAAQINAGLEIIEALGEHYGRSIPIIIDGAESVTKYIDIDAQIIRLSVAEGVEELTVQVA